MSRVQDMVYVKNVIKSLGLTVELPMILEMDNRESIDLANSWSVGGRTRHVGCKLNWLRELKEEGITEYRLVSGDDNGADMHTKNVPGPLLNKHVRVYFGKDKYSSDQSERESVGRDLTWDNKGFSWLITAAESVCAAGLNWFDIWIGD